MKNILLLLTFISSSLFAQDETWFETGASWTYQYQNNGLFEVETHIALFTITEQTSLNDQACAKMEAIGDNPNPLSCNANPAPYYFYESNDSIFFASGYDHTFRLAFDFGAEAGDSWQFKYPVEMTENFTTYLVTVDSISTIQQDGQNLKVMYLDYDLISGEDFSLMEVQQYTVIEKMGATQMFLVPFGYWNVCENHFNTVLQCYTDATTSYIGEGFTSCTVGLNDPQVSDFFKIAPNPSQGSFAVYNSKNLTVEINLYSINGSLVYSGQMQNEILNINTNNLAPGLYVLNIRTEAGVIHKKVVLH